MRPHVHSHTCEHRGNTCACIHMCTLLYITGKHSVHTQSLHISANAHVRTYKYKLTHTHMCTHTQPLDNSVSLGTKVSDTNLKHLPICHTKGKLLLLLLCYLHANLCCQSPFLKGAYCHCSADILEQIFTGKAETLQPPGCRSSALLREPGLPMP